MKMYVLVRNDLSNSQKAVQAGHAVAQYLLTKPDTQWDNGTLIYLGVRDETELNLWTARLTKSGVFNVGFREPDIGDQLTAVALVERDNYFPELRLL